MHVFWRQGYGATSVQDLVEATGVQRGSLYGAFGDKHGLLLEALDAYAEQPFQRLDQLLRESEEPVDAIRQFIRLAGIDSRDMESASRGCLMGNTCAELAPHDEARATPGGELRRQAPPRYGRRPPKRAGDGHV